MAVKGKYRVTKILTAFVWILLGAGIIVLLIAAVSEKNNEHCLKTNIIISDVENNFFIDKKDVIEIIEKTNGGKLEDKFSHNIDLASMEIALQKEKWVRKAELFFDNNNVLQVRVSEREPVSRIFTLSGNSFYMDSSLTRLPLSDKFSVRLPVFTNFPTDLKVLTKRDSSLLRQIKLLSEFIRSDSFWMGQIEQVDINAAGTFELIPKIGNQIIYFGSAENYQRKFRNLLIFYRQVQAPSGWNIYSVIDLRYKGQVIGVRRGANEIKSDSLKAVQIMKTIIANSQKHTNDSTGIQLIQPPDDNNRINKSPVIDNTSIVEISRGEEVNESINKTSGKQVTEQNTESNKNTLNTTTPSFKKPDSVPLKKTIIKPNSKTTQKLKATPKAVMPSKDDY
ncbi:MAG: hypothetical protein ABIO81_04605 [Ginsengibacter sp.]